MNRNIELKARCPDLATTREAARSLGARFEAVLHQTDTYFHCAQGRLKLREINGERAELIAYRRDNTPQARQSNYIIIPVPNPTSIRAALESALTLRGQVVKRRELWLWRNVRIHLDEVRDLGSFLELEAVVSEQCDEITSARNLHELREALRVDEADLVSSSYSDLFGM